MTGGDGFCGSIPLRRYSSDLDMLKWVLLLLSYHVAGNAEHSGIPWNRAVLSIDYANGERIDWTIPVQSAGGGHTVFMKTAPMLFMIPRHPVRMIGLKVMESSERTFTQSTIGEPADRRDRIKDSDIETIAGRLGINPEEMTAGLLDIAYVRDIAERLRTGHGERTYRRS